MTDWVIITLAVCGFLALDAAILYAIFSGVNDEFFNRLAREFPVQSVGDNAAQRTFQSARIGITNLGGCVHFAVDDTYVHIAPAKLLRWFGCKPSSIPLSRVQHATPSNNPKRKDRLRRLTDTKLGPVRAWIPVWVVQEAEQRSAESTSPITP